MRLLVRNHYTNYAQHCSVDRLGSCIMYASAFSYPREVIHRFHDDVAGVRIGLHFPVQILPRSTNEH